MMKKFLSILGIVLLILVGIVSLIPITGHYFKSKNDIKEYDNNTWMNYIEDDTLLMDVVIPGSHDAGSCSINWLGRTQGYSVKDQLRMGTRYFDLRVNKTENGYYMYHAMFNGEKFEDVLNALTEFIQENTSETLILDFQHFKGNSENDVISMVEASLVSQNLVIKNDSEKSDLEFISLLQMKDVRGKCIILFGGNENLVAANNFLFPRNNDSCTKTAQVLNSCYISEYHTMDSDSFMENALPYYYQNIQENFDFCPRTR